MSRTLLTLGFVALTIGTCFVEGAYVGDSDTPSATGKSSVGSSKRGRLVRVAKKKPKAKKSATKKDAPKEADAAPAPAATASTGDLKFSKDIAPIFVNNCIGCHNDKQKRGKLDLTSFVKIMTGTPKEKIIVPGNPDESHLVLRLRGEETPKMPQGGNRSLSDEAVAKIESWVKAGALLDTGIDKDAPIESYASTPEQLRLAELAKMKPADVDKLVEKAGLDRWKKVTSKVVPQVTTGKNFMVFGNLPKNRVDALMKVMDQQYGQVRSLLGPAPLAWGEKASIYVFNDRNSFVQFVRFAENRDIDAEEPGTANFSVPQPYIAAVDPSHGGEEAPAPKRAPRKKEDGAGVATRSLAGLLTEQFVIGTLPKAGKPPKWLSLGLGAFFASKVEGTNPYYQNLRTTAYQLAEQGWPTKANDALGGQTKPEEIRAVGFAIIEWLWSVRPYFAPFVKGMLEGQEKLDDVIAQVLNGNRELFLNESATFIDRHYGRR